MEAEEGPGGAVAAPAESHPRRVRAGAGITWLIDNADAYRALVSACESARSSIWMTQLAFDADCVAYELDDDSTSDLPPLRIADVLVDAATARGVDVRILLNSSFLLDTATALREYIAARAGDSSGVRIRGIRRFPQLLHAKIVVIDGEAAFLLGSPLVNGYWDDSQHAPHDPRRPARELGGRPLHDLSVRFDGAAVAALAHVFAELWNGADDVDASEVHAEPISVPSSAGDAAVRIVRSAPRRRRPGHPAERADIIDALLAGISAAQRSIYIEHQYLSSITVIGALVEALARAPALEIIVVLNQNPDVTAYRGWQNERLASSGLLGHPRVGFFTLWTVANEVPRGALVNQVFVHSKVVIIDDRWAMVGSANLDGVSLETYGDDFSSWLGQRVFRGVRNFDVAAILSSSSGGTGVADDIVELRVALWREHLDAPDLDGRSAPPGGWLSHWRARARANARRLSSIASTDVVEPGIMVLAYSPSSTPTRQLRAAGVVFAHLTLRVAFDPSWMEVHLSPNWVRNMFA